MSGTSLDGLDIAYCEFQENNDSWHFTIPFATTYPYSPTWREKLSSVENQSALLLTQLHTDFGILVAEKINNFINTHKIHPKFIASHGHTIFHQPEKSFTLQIGSGAHIAALTNIKTIFDFRSLDVAKNGQGAPLVPIGDWKLFPDYDICLNIGGIANISFQQEKKRLAFDICPANMALNYLSSLKQLSFDDKGNNAKAGQINPPLLKILNSQDYYHKNGAKSLGKEWFINNIIPLLKSSNISINDKLCTFVEHIAIQIATNIKDKGKSMLITGGGAYNNYLIERIQYHSNIAITIPEKNIIDYKEAMVFAFLGVLRMRNEINTLKSVTGATSDSISGIVI